MIDTTFPFQPYITRPDPKCLAFVFSVLDPISIDMVENLVREYHSAVCLSLSPAYSSERKLNKVRRKLRLSLSQLVTRLIFFQYHSSTLRPTCVLIGAKIDQISAETPRVVPMEQIEKIIASLECKYIEISSRKMTNINLLKQNLFEISGIGKVRNIFF